MIINCREDTVRLSRVRWCIYDGYGHSILTNQSCLKRNFPLIVSLVRQWANERMSARVVFSLGAGPVSTMIRSNILQNPIILGFKPMPDVWQCRAIKTTNLLLGNVSWPTHILSLPFFPCVCVCVCVWIIDLKSLVNLCIHMWGKRRD